MHARLNDDAHLEASIVGRFEPPEFETWQDLRQQFPIGGRGIFGQYSKPAGEEDIVNSREKIVTGNDQKHDWDVELE